LDQTYSYERWHLAKREIFTAYFIFLDSPEQLYGDFSNSLAPVMMMAGGSRASRDPEYLRLRSCLPWLRLFKIDSRSERVFYHRIETTK
jgi:hypothetical protein